MQSPLITFHVLGTLVLRGPAGRHIASPLAGSKRLALLSYLALATPRGPHRRDRVLALLWPEASPASARNSLSNMIFQIRRALGREVLVASDDEIGLAAGTLWCDAVVFEEALDQGFVVEALDMYRGDLLEGFFVSGAAAEFDQWLEGQRERLRGRAADAARLLADQAEQAGNLSGAVGWARRVCALDRYSEPDARRLIACLDRSGDRAGALRAYESFAHLFSRVLEAQPSAETQALIQRVRARNATAEAAGLSIRALAVLPFDNLSGTSDAEVFAAGVHDDLLNELSRISALSVIARTSVLRYRSSAQPANQVGRELGVGTLIEGAVQTSGGRLRLNVQLIDARTGVHRWAAQYDRDLTTGGILDLQSELVKQIARSLQAELSPGERVDIGPRTGDLEAYRLYAQGRRLLDERAEGPLRQAVSYFDRAIQRDDEYALAWVGLADALSLLHDYGYEDAQTVLPRAEQAIRRALALDEDLAEARASLGLLYSNRREGPASVRELQRSIALRPGYAEAHNWLGWTYQCLGRPAEALECARRAVRLNPLSREAISNLSVTCLANGDPETAVREARRLREIEPTWSTGAFYEGLALYRLRKFEEACDVLQDLSVSWIGSGPRAALALASVARAAAPADAMLEEFERDGDQFSVGLIHAARGQVDEAFEAFGRVDDWGAYWPTLSVHLYYPDVLGPLRVDPRFPAILHEIHRCWGVLQDQ